MLTAFFVDISFAQVQGSAVSRGIQIGTQQSRGTTMMSSFNRFSTGLESVTQPITRTSRDPLSVRTSVNMLSPMQGSTGSGGLKSTARPSKTNILIPARPRNSGVQRPARPTMFNNMLSSAPTMTTVGNLPRGRIFTMEYKVGPLRPIRNKTTPFSIRPQTLLRPDIQQQKTRLVFGGSLSLAQRKAITHQTALTQNLLTSKNLQLSRKPTIFDIGRQRQNKKEVPQSIFNLR